MTYLKNLLLVLVLFIMGFSLTCANVGMQNIPDLQPNEIINGTLVGTTGDGTVDGVNTGFVKISADCWKRKVVFHYMVKTTFLFHSILSNLNLLS